MGYIAPPSELTLSDPSGEPIFEVINTGTINDGRRAVGTMVLDPDTAEPVGPSTPQMVSDSSATALGFRLAVSTTPLLILAADPRRTCATVRNVGPDDIDLDGTNAVISGQGFLFHMNEAFDVRTKAEVWGVSNGNTVLSVWVETL